MRYRLLLSNVSTWSISTYEAVGVYPTTPLGNGERYLFCGILAVNMQVND